ncbi:B3 domain-containing protein Os03g0184500-like isoform X2 [Rhododendron vialii]|uniref:B3 domain-containing protein Os03g0184500-like isoform X2 n=1 Tax=Rhododendron vialii TaxID=182163 RepID=UPI00265E8449|nr:B3 domain-containing protein Os03g0184500-like isoform X2 [Rhododendron vialii]
MKQEKGVKNKKRLLDLYHHKTKKVAFYGYGQPRSRPRTVDGLYDSVQANPLLMNRVKEVEENLDPKFPIFVKSMNRSAVTVGFMLKLSRPFADLHMPGCDASVVLVDAFDEEEYRTKYLVAKSVFSGGWKAFSIAHRLLEGDVLIFQLIKPCEFKVYVVRESELGEVDGAVALVHLLKGDGRQLKSENSTNTTMNHQDNGRHLKYLPPDNIQENSKKEVGLLLEEINSVIILSY